MESNQKSLWEEARLFRACFYGDFGAGKTSLAASIIEACGGSAVAITADSAWPVIHKFPEVAKNTRRYDFEGFMQVRAICQAKEEGIEPFASADWLLWDTVSTSVLRTLKNLVEAYPTEDQRKTISVNGKPSERLPIEAYTHYNLAAAKLTETIEMLNKSKFNIIYTAHVRDPNDKERAAGKFAIRPDMPEACYKAVAREVPLIGWLHKEVKGAQRKIQLEGTISETAKSQIPTIPEKTYLQDEIPALVKQWKEQR